MYDIDCLIIDYSNTIKEALIKLDITAKKILFVTGSDKRLLGTVTDGDIRRWILKNGDVNLSVENIMNKKPVYLEQKHEKNALAIMKEKKIKAIPVNEKAWMDMGEINEMKNMVDRMGSKKKNAR